MLKCILCHTFKTGSLFFFFFLIKVILSHVNEVTVRIHQNEMRKTIKFGLNWFTLRGCENYVLFRHCMDEKKKDLKVSKVELSHQRMSY